MEVKKDFIMQRDDVSKNKNVAFLKRLGKLIIKRVCADIMSLPFLLAWSTLICYLLARASDNKVNAFLKSTFDEGVGLRTIFAMLILSFFIAGIAWLVRPAPGKVFYNILLAPARAARSACITTLAFVSGLACAITLAQGLGHTSGLARSLVVLGILWLMLNFLEALTSDASSIRERKYKWYCICFGLLMMFFSMILTYFLYGQIKSGVLV